MYLVYVDNKAYPKVKSVAEELATDDHKVQYRNPEYFSGTGEFKKAERVFVFGEYPEVTKAAKKAKVSCKQVDIPKDKKSKSKGSKSDNSFEDLPDDTEFPYNYGGNWWFLSNGDKHQGDEESATEAEEALNETDDA